MQHEESRSFQRDDVRHHVIPAYMALVKQIDDHLGRLLQFLEAQGRLADTMIVLTSDHGDYLGDHWLGEKELFYEASVRVPMLVYDPDPAADATRGTQSCQHYGKSSTIFIACALQSIMQRLQPHTRKPNLAWMS